MQLSELLSPRRIKEVAPAVEDIRTLPDQFRGLSRVPFMPAEDGDILARVSGREVAGDILPDGARPLPKQAAPITLEQIAIANFKRSVKLGASQLALLARIVSNGGVPGEIDSFGSYIGDTVRRNRMGNMARAEQCVWGMFLDTFTYSYAGTQFTVTWNKPSNLKATTAVSWGSSPSSATPVTDVQSLVITGADQYGVQYDRMEITTTDLINLVNTTQFQNISKSTLGIPSGGTLAPAGNNAYTRDLAARVLGVDKVLVMDRSIDIEALDGTISTSKLLPTGKVLLSRSSDDDNSMTWDFANGIVLESIVAAIVGIGSGGMVGGFAGIDRGPIGFAIGDLPSANVELFDVIRGFPRTKNPAATAVLTLS